LKLLEVIVTAFLAEASAAGAGHLQAAMLRPYAAAFKIQHSHKVTRELHIGEYNNLKSDFFIAGSCAGAEHAKGSCHFLFAQRSTARGAF